MKWGLAAIIGFMLVTNGCQTPVALNSKPGRAAGAPTSLPPGPGDFPMALATGGSVELIAVNDDENRRSWKLNGEKLANWIDVPINVEDGQPGKQRRILCFIDAPREFAPPSVACLINRRQVTLSVGATPASAKSGLGQGQSESEIGHYLAVVYARILDNKPVDLKVQIAAGRWQSLGTYTLDRGIVRHASGYAFNPVVTNHINLFGETGVRIGLTPPDLESNYAFRLVVKDIAGRPVEAPGELREGEPAKKISCVTGGTVDDIGSIELQTRPYQRFYFTKVPLAGPIEKVKPGRGPAGQ